MAWTWGILASSGSGLGSAYDLIQNISLANPVQTVTFTGIDSLTGYKHLQLRISARATTPAALAANLRMRFNYDITATSNDGNFFNLGAATSQTTANTAQNIMLIPNGLPAATSTSNLWGTFVIEILDFSSTAKRKSWKAIANAGYDSTLPDGRMAIGSGLWSSTTAISTIELSTPTNEFVASSRFGLYGVKA